MLYQDLYDRALDTTQETDQLVFQHTLKWMLSAKKRITQCDFFLAVSAFTGLEVDDLDEEFILDLLSNFVVSSTTEEGDRFFRFAHLSVREFLEHMPEYSTEWTNTFAAEVTLFTLVCTSDAPSSKEFIHKLGDIPLGIAPLSGTRSSGNDIYGYSLKFWSEHCVLAGEKNRSADGLKLRKLLHFFLLEYLDDNRRLNCWAPVLRSWSTESLEKIKKIYQSSDDRAFLLACVYGFNEIVRITLSHNLDQSVKEQGAMMAFQGGHTSIADLLIGSQDDAKLREYVLHHMGNTSESHRLKDPGLARWLVNFFKPAQITEDVVINALKLNNAETVGILLDYNSNLHITEEMIIKSFNSPRMLAAFLAQEPNISSTSRILMTAIGYQSMDTISHPPKNTELLVNLIRRCDPAVITCDVITCAAGWAGSIEQQEQAMPILLLLLERAGYIHVNQRAASLAFERDCTGEVTSILLDHGWPVTSVVVLHAAKHGKSAAFPRILEAAGGSCQITRKLLVTAADNYHKDGKEILEHLVSQLNQPIDDETWESMIVTCARPDSLQIILDMMPQLQVPESALLSIVANSYVRAEHFGVLLNDGRELQITDAVVREALRNLRPKAMSPEEIALLLLNRHGAKSVTEHMLISAVSNEEFGGEMTRVLMHRKVPVEVPSAKVIDAVIENTYSGLEALEVLEEYLGPLEYTDKQVESVALGSGKMMKIVFDRRSITQTSESMLSEAARRGTLDGVYFLLQLDNTIVTRETLIAAAGNGNCGAEMLRLLWDRNPEIEPCIEMFMEAAGCAESRTLRFLVDRLVDVKFVQQLLEAATTGTSMRPHARGILVESLLDSTLPVQVTRKMAASVRTNHPGSFLWRVLAPYAMAMETSTETADT